MRAPNIIDFEDLSMSDVPLVGGKNAALGELCKHLRPLGVQAVDGFAVTADAYRSLLSEGGLRRALTSILAKLDPSSIESLSSVAKEARNAILATSLPAEL